MSHLPADFHRRLEIKPRPQAYAIVNGEASILPDVKGDIMPRIGEDVLIHLGRPGQWVRHTVVGFYAWPSLQGHPSLVRLYVRVVDSDGIFNSRQIHDVRRMNGTYFNNMSQS